MPSRIADTEPPVMPPTKTPSSIEIAGTGGIPKVNGSISASAIENVSPGMEPTISPTTVPSAVARMVLS